VKIEQTVTANYARNGIAQAILELARQRRSEPGPLTATDLAGVDELHIGGLSATLAFARSLKFAPGSRVIDLGCGIGGPARIVAQGIPADVTGVDLVANYVEAATELTREVGLDDRCRFINTSVFSLPFGSDAFDGAYMIALGMNVSDKFGVFREARRILKPGARFGVCDPMRIGGGDVRYPLPWSATSAGSFLEPPSTYRTLIEGAGFAIEDVIDRSAMARRFFQKAGENASETPRVDLSALLGENVGDRVANIADAVEAGVVAPVEIIARAV
jgi:SAM-dependent methyltransferase